MMIEEALVLSRAFFPSQPAAALMGGTGGGGDFQQGIACLWLISAALSS